MPKIKLRLPFLRVISASYLFHLKSVTFLQPLEKLYLCNGTHCCSLSYKVVVESACRAISLAFLVVIKINSYDMLMTHEN